MGVDMMELDLKMTKDSVLVLCHDGTLDRTTTGHGLVSDYTYEELLQFDLKRGHGIAIPGLKIPTLRQALEVCKDRITVNVDQGYQYYDQVLEIAEEWSAMMSWRMPTWVSRTNCSSKAVTFGTMSRRNLPNIAIT